MDCELFKHRILKQIKGQSPFLPYLMRTPYHYCKRDEPVYDAVARYVSKEFNLIIDLINKDVNSNTPEGNINFIEADMSDGEWYELSSRDFRLEFEQKHYFESIEIKGPLIYFRLGSVTLSFDEYLNFKIDKTPSFVTHAYNANLGNPQGDFPNAFFEALNNRRIHTPYYHEFNMDVATSEAFTNLVKKFNTMADAHENASKLVSRLQYFFNVSEGNHIDTTMVMALKLFYQQNGVR